MDGEVLFCHYSKHSINFIRVDMIKDHLRSMQHVANKEKKVNRAGASSSQQVTLSTVLKSKDVRQEFILDYVKLCTIADIPLEKTEKLRPFLRK